MSRGVRSTEEVENCLWGLSSSVHRLLTLRCRCSRSISLSSCRFWRGEAGKEKGKRGGRGDGKKMCEKDREVCGKEKGWGRRKRCVVKGGRGREIGREVEGG